MQCIEKVDILLVDDREDGLIALEALLGDNPQYRLVKAQSGREAYGLLHLHDFGLILLDVQMPDLDGFQTAELMRKEARFASIPILFVTAINKDDRYIYRGYEAGAVDYIFKPFDPMILISKVGVFADLHLRKRQVERQAAQLREQEHLAHQTKVQLLELQNLRHFRALADAVPHMVWEAEADGTITYHNRQCESYTGLSFDDGTAQSGWLQALQPKDERVFLASWMQATRSRQKFELELQVRRHDNQYRWHLIRVVPELDEHGKLLSWIGTCTDINDQKEIQVELLEARKSAESANEAKTQFLANMSHEIRTPLNAILGFTELMMGTDVTTEERQNSLSIVRRNSQQLLKIIDEILDISKVEAGGMQVEMLETDLPSLISGIRSLLRVSSAKKEIKLILEAASPLPEKVMTDSTRLRQVLMNLVGNAIKFTAVGHVAVVSRWHVKPDGKTYLQFSVTDTGAGIAPEMAEKIFLPFLQADSSTTRLYGGTGLGLTLSRKLSRALGGDLWLEKSEVGAGSTFVAEFEVEPCVNSSWFNSFTDLSPLSSGVEGLGEKRLRGVKILLAEDGEDNQILMSHLLSSQGAKIDIAQNGEEAVEKALSNDYQLILMDIQMPLMDGYEATHRLREAGYKQPIIALTAHAMPEEKDRSLRTGCNAHLTKPLNRQQLIDRLTHYLSQAQT